MPTRATALTGVLAISFAAIFVRLAAATPETATLFRTVYALPAVALVYLATRDRDDRDRRARTLAFASGVILAIDLTLFHRSIELIGAGLATVLANAQVIIVGAIAWLVHRERPPAQALAAVPVLIVGVALISGIGSGDAYGDDPVGGALYGLGAAFAYSAFLLVFRASNRRHLAPTAGPLLDATAGAAIGALLTGLPGGAIDFAVSWPTHGWLLALALVAQTAGWLFIARALPRLPALDTSIMLLLQPAASVLWAQLIFAEDLSAGQWLGAAAVVAGIAASAIRRPAARSATTVSA